MFPVTPYTGNFISLPPPFKRLIDKQPVKNILAIHRNFVYWFLCLFTIVRLIFFHIYDPSSAAIYACPSFDDGTIPHEKDNGDE